MSNPTSSFGWQMPTASDLVTDLPADFETFGQAVDTTLADLKGGTTGQVLSKASNTDMDFTWVAQDDSNAIQNAIVDAKGDLIAATAADTPARLAVGTNGQVLTADSTASTGLAWATASAGSSNVAGKNGCINGGFDVWQRGTSFTAASVYTADRWFSDGGTGRTFSQQATSDTTNLPTIKYALRMQRNSGQTWTGAFGVISSFENLQSQPFIGQTVTLSFWAKAGANMSATSNALTVKVYAGTGTDQRRDFSSAFTGETQPISSSATLTTSWQRFTYTATVGATMTQIAIGLYYSATGTAGAADYADITGVQIEVASSASAFSRNAASYESELAACQRYFQSIGGDMTYELFGVGSAISSTEIIVHRFLPVKMRTTPSFSYSSVSNWQAQMDGVSFAVATSIATTNGISSQVASAIVNFSADGSFGSNKACSLRANNTTSARFYLSAEL